MRKILIQYILLLLSFWSIGQNKKLDSLFKQISKGKEDSSTVDALNYIARSYRNSNIDTSVFYIKKALDLSDKINFTKGRIQALTLLGFINERKGFSEEAFSNLNEAVTLSKKIGNLKEEARALASIGDLLFSQQNAPESMKHYLLAIKIFEKLDPNDTKIAQINNQLGILNFMQGNTKRAFEYLFKSLDLMLKTGDSTSIAYSYIYIGNVHGDIKQYDSSNFHYLRAYNILKKRNDLNALVAVESNIGQNYNETGDFIKALQYFEKANSGIIELQDRAGEVNNLVNIGSSYCNLKKYDKAVEYFEKAIRIAKEIKSWINLRNSFKSLAYTYNEMRDYKSAYFYLNRHLEIKDSLFSDESQAQIAEMESKYQNEKKALMIKNLKEEQELKDSEVKKERLLKYVGFAGMMAALIIGIILMIGFINKRKDNRIIRKQKEEVDIKNREIEHQKNILNEKNNEITDSINYAKRLQKAILPSNNQVNELLTKNFILFKPKDIVAGDFYWFEKVNELVLFAAADCTGHGVPGAMVSIVCSNALNKSVMEFGITDPGKILDKTREIVISTFSKSGENVQDGMDISLCSLNTDTLQLQWAGANNPLLIHDGLKITEIRPDKQPVAKYEKQEQFTTHNLTLKKGDTIYLFTDGFADQFGGPKGKKFKHKQFVELILNNANQNMSDQLKIFDQEIENWKSNLEQVDDICVIGVRV